MELTIDDMEKNLLASWDMTTPLQRYRGMEWYPFAHDFAYVIGNGNVSVAAAVIAALSPQKAWVTNMGLATDAMNGDIHGHVGDALAKVRRILAGEDPTTVLPMNKKTGHFYMNILDPTNADYVTLDRHAIRVATLDWDNGAPTIRDSLYPKMVCAFQNTASKVGVAPSVFQAGLWLYAKER